MSFKVEKRVKFFRNVIANLVIVAVILSVLVFAVTDDSVAASQKPVYKGNSSKNVSLMVNVYWGTEYLDEMLKIFEDNGAKTTFFVGGMWAAENDEMLKKIYSAGHEIGNHGYFHKDHKKLSAERNKEEINVTHQLVKSIIGIDMTLFAPPSGSFNDTTLTGAKSLGYTTIMWTYDTIDWRDHDSELIYSRAVKNLSGGNLILMHPTAETVKALPKILKTIKDAGLNIAPVSQALN